MPYSGEIQKVEIKRLYHNIDVSFDLTKDCTILIGENGIGKTTALRILQHLLEGKFIYIARYIFDSIWVTDGDRTYKYKKEFFEIPIEMLLNKYMGLFMSTMGEDDVDEIKKQFEFLLVDLEKQGLLGELLYCLVEKHYSFIIRNIVESYIDNPESLFNLSIELDKDRECYLDSAIYKSEYNKKIKERKRFYWNQKAIYGDMVNNVKFSEDGFDLGSIREFRQSFFQRNNDTNDRGEVSHMPYFGFSLDEICQDVMSYLTYKYQSTGLLDINSAIQLVYYESIDISKLRSLAKEGERRFIEAVNNKKTYSDELISNILKLFNDKVYFIHEYYIRPLLPDNSIYNVNLQRNVRRILNSKTIKLSQKQKEIIALLESYINIFGELQELVLSPNYVRNYIRSFQDIISQYITDKEIRITPMGVLLYLKTCGDVDVIDESSKRIDFSDDENFLTIGNIASGIPINSLSSGERKIIALAFYAIFADRAILIMDEPEVSVSILWQERLLADLLDYGNFNSIIIATHSPYIARDDSLSDYIEYLP